MKNFLKKKTQNLQNKTYNVIVPSGLIGHTEKGYFYIKGLKKFKIVSERAMKSWCLPVINTTEDKLSNFRLAGHLGFRDGTLIKDISDGKIYLVSDSKRRHITDPDILEWLNTDIIMASQKEVLIHEEGENF